MKAAIDTGIAVRRKQGEYIFYLLNIIGIDCYSQFTYQPLAALRPIPVIAGQRQLVLSRPGHGVEGSVIDCLGAQYLHNSRMTPMFFVKQANFFELRQVRGYCRQYEPVLLGAFNLGPAHTVEDGGSVDRLIDDRQELENGLLKRR